MEKRDNQVCQIEGDQMHEVEDKPTWHTKEP